MKNLGVIVSIFISLVCIPPASAEKNYDWGEALLADSAGRITPPDYRAIRILFQQSLDAGYIPANGKLGDIYQHGYGVKASPEKAFSYYQAGAAGRDAYSMFRLGVAYEEGAGTPGDVVKGRQYIDDALAIFLRQAAAGDAQSQFFVGMQYIAGRYLPQSDQKALALFSKAAAQNHRASLLVMGKHYNSEVDDIGQATEYYNKAIVQGEFQAYVDLGAYYFYIDPVKSRKFFQKGCDHDIALACKNLTAVDEYIVRRTE
ncbi:tetratricopeptide repeat protein [Morganella psychrotolerans]|uniref:Sel1 repeat family protein n=1 Tax=Morganella psychrotolerans TaxID=368603 RepID=A0A1B8HNR0_9GAMM|nr:tetratricopeptide repeat protein [Morganella psychrotolerans]OBU11002.1 hypothetical protein AYY18_03430 [Morganella psychrotolerans]